MLIISPSNSSYIYQIYKKKNLEFTALIQAFSYSFNSREKLIDDRMQTAIDYKQQDSEAQLLWLSPSKK